MNSRLLVTSALVYTSVVSYVETKNLEVSIVSLILAILIYFLPSLTSRKAG